MMPTREEIARGVTGAWLLFRFDRAGMWQFDLSIRGFWRSFWAPALMLPLYAVLIAASQVAIRDDTAINIEDGVVAAQQGDVVMPVVARCLAFALAFTLWPLVAAAIARAFNLTASYVPYIIAYNWATVISLLLQVPASLLIIATGDAPSFAPLALWFATQIIVFGYQFLIARIAFAAPAGLAAALVMLDLLLALGVDYVAEWAL